MLKRTFRPICYVIGIIGLIGWAVILPTAAVNETNVLENASVSREKAKQAKVINVEKEKAELWRACVIMIKDTADSGKFSIELTVDKYQKETVDFVVEKLKAKGYSIDIFSTQAADYKWITISW